MSTVTLEWRAEGLRLVFRAWSSEDDHTRNGERGIADGGAGVRLPSTIFGLHAVQS